MSRWFRIAVGPAVLLLGVATLAAVAPKQDPDLSAFDAWPPVVVNSVPASCATEVDPALKEIRVTYNREMNPEGYSWTTFGDDTFPTNDGKPRFDADGRTAVLPVKLEPGKTYAVYLNSPRHGNFKDKRGSSAIPYLLLFRTRG